MTRSDRIFDLEGTDPLDAQIPHVDPVLRLTWLDVLLRRRATLGLTAVTPPAVLFVPLGILLGPSVSSTLGVPALSHLDAVVAVSLAAIGVFVGLALDLRGRGESRLVAAAVTQAAVCGAVVAASAAYLVTSWQLPIDLPLLATAATLGLCASTSSAGSSEVLRHQVHNTACRVANLDDVVPVLGGGLLLAGLHASDGRELALLAAAPLAIGAALALAGWLLFERARTPAERVVYVLGVVGAIGGCAIYARVSPLLAGATAGLLWSLAPGRADQVAYDDLRKMQHPLVALLLLAAGARLVLTLDAIWLFAPLVLYRLAGKLLGAWFAAPLVAPVRPSDLAAYLVAPGTMGIALALLVQQVTGAATATALLTAVAMASIASELLALVALPSRRPS